MRRNHQPLWLHRALNLVRDIYTRRIISPQFDRLGEGLTIFEPRTLVLFGSNINAGKHLHVISNKLKPVQLSTWSSKQQQGKIDIGDYVLLSPGVQCSSAEHIRIGDNCMIAADTVISDSDWHGTYNRTRPFRCSEAINIDDNVWIGQRSIIGKGVHIGENSIVAAGSVVVHNVPANTIVGGNPAQALKSINPNKRMLKREFLFTQGTDYAENQKKLSQYLAANNSTVKWLKTLVAPSKHD